MNLNYVKIILLCVLGFFVSLAADGAIYVDGDFGDDSWNGSTDIPGAPNGPKRTIAAALKVASDLESIVITGANYNDRLVIVKRFNFILTGPISVKSITMNGNPARLSLSGGFDLIVADTLNMLSGNIDASITNSNLVAATTCKVLGGSRSSFIEGKLFRANTDVVVTNMFFPMGISGDYRPVYMTFNQSTSTSNRYIAQVLLLPAPTASLPPEIKNVSRVHYWSLRYTGSATPSSISIKVFYDSGKADDEVSDPSKLRLVILRNGTTTYRNLGGSGTAKLKGTITAAYTTDTLGSVTLGNVQTGLNTLGQKTPLAKFGYSGQCVNAPVQFRDSSYSSKNAIVRRLWIFGTGNPADTSNLALPKFTYTSKGPFWVTLRVWNSLGLEDSTGQAVSLKNGPDARFTTGDGCLGRPLFFADSSTISAPDTIKTRKWDLGDGNFKTVKSFSHLYPLPLKYTVKLVVSSNSGCVDTFIKAIQINKKPGPAFTTAKICKGESTDLNGSGGNAGDTITSWKWAVNNVITATTQKTSKIFDSAGTFKVSLMVASQSGCLDTLTKNVVIYRPPVALFYLDPTFAGNDSLQCYTANNFKLKDVSRTFQGQVLTAKYLWGSPASPGGNSISMTNSGIFPVTMVVTSDKGCMDSSLHYYKVFDKIDIRFATATYCLPNPAIFSDSSKTGSATITKIKWRFGDGNQAQNTPASHVYPSGGTYTVWDVVSTSDGCTDSLSQAVVVTAKPTISILAGSNNPFCAYDSLRVQVIGGKYVKWDEGDTNRVRYFHSTSVRKATAFTSPFCFVTDSVSPVAFPPVFPNAGLDTSLIKGRYTTLKGDGGIKYSWQPSGLCESPDSVKTRVKPLASTTFILKVTDANNCVGYDSVRVKVVAPLFIRIPNMITPNEDGKNDVWDLREVPNIENSKVSIYNQLGELVFVQNTGYDHTWQGTFTKGGNLPRGNYLYVIEIPTEKEPLKGYLFIAR